MIGKRWVFVLFLLSGSSWAVTISNIQVTYITHSGAMATWTTDVPSDTEVDYGTSTAYGYTVAITSTIAPVSTSHYHGVSGFTPNTVSHFRVRSVDAGGNTGVSGDNVFTTLSQASPVPSPLLYKMDTTLPLMTGVTTYVNATACGSTALSTCLQNAINNANLGDTIKLAAGVTFSGNFTLPYKAGSGWIIIRTDASDASLPPSGTRIDPSFAAFLPKLWTPNTTPAIQTINGSPAAHNYRLMGLEIGEDPSWISQNPASGGLENYGFVTFGAGDQTETSLAVVPQYLVVDRCYIHGDPAINAKRGVQINSAWTAVVDSYISEIHVIGQDTQCISTSNGTGPFRIFNNYLEAAGENIIFGGAQAYITGLIPSDIDIEHNYFFKPLSWNTTDPSYGGIHWTVKNLLELKNAQRVLVDGNVFQNCWPDAQDGYGMDLTPRSQNGLNPWATVQDVTITHNHMDNVASGFDVLGWDDSGPSQQMARVLIQNNLITSVYGSTGWLAAALDGTEDLQFDHNTITGVPYSLLDLAGVPFGAPTNNAASADLAFTNSITPVGLYGPHSSFGSTAAAMLSSYCPMSGYSFTKNALINAPSGSPSGYPTDNFFPASMDAVGFVNWPGGDYHLSSASPYKNTGTDGKDLGADIDAVNAATCGALIGNFTGCSTSGSPPPPPPPTSMTTGAIFAPRVYPNPWRSDRYTGTPITFDQLTGNATIKIFTVSGHLVKTLATSGNAATWQLDNDSGDKVASGIYVYLVTNDQGQKSRGKVAIIR